jgi:hypothetical protein
MADVSVPKQIRWHIDTDNVATLSISSTASSLSEVSTTDSLLWDITTAVSTTDTFLWDTVATVSTTDTFLWSIVATVSTTDTYLWDIQSTGTPVSTTDTLSWDIRIYPYIYNVDLDNTIYNGQSSVAINGVNFGTITGTVDIDGVFQTSLSWSDTQIIIPAVNLTGLAYGQHTLRVRRG